MGKLEQLYAERGKNPIPSVHWLALLRLSCAILSSDCFSLGSSGVSTTEGIIKSHPGRLVSSSFRFWLHHSRGFTTTPILKQLTLHPTKILNAQEVTPSPSLKQKAHNWHFKKGLKNQTGEGGAHFSDTQTTKETHKKKKKPNFNEKNGTCCWISKLHKANKMKDKEWGEENRKMKRMRRDEKRKRFPIDTWQTSQCTNCSVGLTYVCATCKY